MGSLGLSPQGQTMYELMLKDTAFIKRQQWAVTNYAALIYAAIIWIAHNLRHMSQALSCVLMSFAIITAVVSIGILVWFQFDLSNLRIRIAHANDSLFSDDEKAALSLRYSEPDPFTRGWHILAALVLVCAAGGLLAIFAIIGEPSPAG